MLQHDSDYYYNLMAAWPGGANAAPLSQPIDAEAGGAERCPFACRTGAAGVQVPHFALAPISLVPIPGV